MFCPGQDSQSAGRMLELVVEDEEVEEVAGEVTVEGEVGMGDSNHVKMKNKKLIFF